MNVITLDVYKNTVRKHDGFNPTESEKNYTQLLFRFQQDDEWAKCNIITASFFLSADEIVKSDAELLAEDLTSTFSIPTEFTGRRGTLYVGLQGIYSDGEDNITISTNIIAIDRTKGTIIQEGAPQNLYEKLIVLWNKYVKQIDDEIVQKIDPTVIAYLAEHPELTTTVQNGAITESKLAKALQLRKANFYRDVAEMKADENLIEGMSVITLGYYAPNDLGSAEYVIGNSGNIALNNGLYAQVIVKPQMNVECFGAVGDGETDDSAAIAEASSCDTHIIFSNKTYLIANTVNVQNSIYWVGNETTLKISDDVNVDSDLLAIFYINGESYFEGFTIEYNSEFYILDSETTGATGEYPHLTVIKPVAGKDHFMKNVSINITEADDLEYGAEVAAVWYNFSTDETRRLYVDNCEIVNLTTGHNTATGCIWTTGVLDNIVIKNSKFTRNHSGDIVTFWANEKTIGNVLIDNCIFNASNDADSGAACLQFGASATYPTIFENINIRNSIFNVGRGFGAPCIAVSTQDVTVNIDSCLFVKDVETQTGDTEYKKRLEIGSMEQGGVMNIRNSKIECAHSTVHLFDIRSASPLCELNITDSEIYSYSNIYNSANANLLNTKLTIGDTSGYTYLQTPTGFVLTTNIQNCVLDCPVNNRANMTISNSICKRKIQNNVSLDGIELNLINAQVSAYSVSCAKDEETQTDEETGEETTVERAIVLSDFNLINNSITKLELFSGSTAVSIADVGTFATTAILSGNINTTSRTMIDTVIV